MKCLSTYVELEEEGYSSAARRRLSDGRKLPARLDFARSELIDIRAETFEEMSISGVQEKVSLQLRRGVFRPVATGGSYILKPSPGQSFPRFGGEVPANESLTIQLAEQVFGVETAANGLVRLADGELAYLTRRFDRTPEGSKIAQEDFCQLMGRTPATHGARYKYDSSYEELGDALHRFVAASSVEVERLFRRIVFNYAVGNGDAHLKNFSLRATPDGDYLLSPAYDLVNTKLHLPNEPRLALDLLAGDELAPGLLVQGWETGGDFMVLAERLGVLERRARGLVEETVGRLKAAIGLVRRSFLSDEAKETYAAILQD